MAQGWNTAEVAGRHVDWYEPTVPHPQGFAVLYLHGVRLGRIADQPALMELFERHGLRVVCPWAGRCWWLDRPCPEFPGDVTPERHVVQNVVPWMIEQLGVPSPAIALLGTSMGGQGALRLAFKYPNRFPVTAAISPAIDFQQRLREGDEVLYAMFPDEEAARQETALLHIHALNWPRHTWFCCDPTDERWYESSERLRMKLSSLGIPFECDLQTSHGGHSWDYYQHMAPAAIAFLLERLEKERLRVV